MLVDAGMGPTEMAAGDEDEPCRLFGGQLPVGLRALGVARDDVTDVVCTHLHPDHVGGLFDLESRPSFPRATIWFGGGDWRFFIEGRDTPIIQDHVHHGFQGHAGDARLRPIDRDTTVAPGITALRPGTPSATSTRTSPTGPASGSGVSWRARTAAAWVRTSRSSSSDASSRAAERAGGRDAPGGAAS